MRYPYNNTAPTLRKPYTIFKKDKGKAGFSSNYSGTRNGQHKKGCKAPRVEEGFIYEHDGGRIDLPSNAARIPSMTESVHRDLA